MRKGGPFSSTGTSMPLLSGPKLHSEVENGSTESWRLALPSCEPFVVCFCTCHWCEQLFYRNGKCNSHTCTESGDDPIFRSWDILNWCCSFCRQGETTCLGLCQEACVALMGENLPESLNPPCWPKLHHLEKTRTHPLRRPQYPSKATFNASPKVCSLVSNFICISLLGRPQTKRSRKVSFRWVPNWHVEARSHHFLNLVVEGTNSLALTAESWRECRPHSRNLGS